MQVKLESHWIEILSAPTRNKGLGKYGSDTVRLVTLPTDISGVLGVASLAMLGFCLGAGSD